MMTPERWQQIDQLYQAALDQEAADRSKFISSACGDDSELRREVESLLKAHEQAGSFIAEPALRSAAKLLAKDQKRSLIGATLAHYQIESILGAGGMGEVYLALDVKLNRKVALKLLPASFINYADQLGRFEREAQAASALNHSNIITIYEIVEVDGHHFIVTEFVDGETLREYMTNTRMTVGEVLDVAAQIASALQAAHEARIVHRDIKPENIMVRRDGVVKVLDFGLAKLAPQRLGTVDVHGVNQSKVQTSPGMVMGTVGYMSPEQARGQEVDARTDIWSLGIVLYEMVAGRTPFKGDTPNHVIVSILENQPTSLCGDSGVPAELERIISKSLRKDTVERYQTASDIALDLKNLKEDLTIEARLKQLKGSSDDEAFAAFATAQAPGVDTSELSGANSILSAEYLLNGIKRHRGSVVFASMAALLLIASLVYFFNIPSGRSGPKDSVALFARPLTTDQGFEGMPSLSPDGNYVAFIAGGGELQKDFDLYVKQIGGGPPLRLTSGPAVEEFPAWSPDGRSIAFVRTKGDKLDVLLIAPIGGPERKVAEVTADTSTSVFSFVHPYLSWSPDSKFLVTTDRQSLNEPLGLFLLSVSTGEKRRLTSPPPPSLADGNPAVSPDGRSLAFVRLISFGHPQLFVLPLTEDYRPGAEARHINLAQPWVVNPVWSHDGREILCSVADQPWTSRPRLWRVPVANPESSKPVALVGENASQFAVSSQAHRLVYADWTADYDIWRTEISKIGSNSPPLKLIASTQSDSCPRYSPDGSKIAFDSDRSGHTEIWVCNSDGSNPLQLTSLESFSENPRWFPNGRHIVFDSNKEGQIDVYLLDTDSPVPRRLTDDLSDDVTPSVSRDGNWIYFASRRTGRFEIWRMASKGGKPIQLTFGGGDRPLESAHETVVYYVKRVSETKSEVWKVPVSGGDEGRVLGPVNAFGYSISVVPQGVYFVEIGTMLYVGSSGNSLKFYSFASSATEIVANVRLNPNNGLSISPDGRYALMTLLDPDVCDLMVVDNFR